MRIDPTREYQKWLQFDPRLIFTHCGALTWYLRKAWLLDHAPELMPPSHPAEAFDIRRSVRSRLAKADYFSHVRIRARLAFADHLLYERRTGASPTFGSGPTVYHSQPAAAISWQQEHTPLPLGGEGWGEGARESGSVPGVPKAETFVRPGKPRGLKVADVGHQWIYLKWKWPRSKVTRLGYRIERSRRKNGGYEVIAVTHACDLLLVPVNRGTNYFYRVRAFNPAGDGPPSEATAGISF